MQPAGEKIVRNLQDAVERLHKDIARVELWAGALQGFVAPVPGYDPGSTHLNRFALAPRSSHPHDGTESARTATAEAAAEAARTERKSGPVSE